MFTNKKLTFYTLLAGTIIVNLVLPELCSAQPNVVTRPTRVTIDVTELERGTCTIFYLVEGPYGALLASLAGLGAIATAALGSYKNAWNLLIVSISCFIMRSAISLWFKVPDNCGAYLRRGASSTTQPNGGSNPSNTGPQAPTPQAPTPQGGNGPSDDPTN